MPPVVIAACIAAVPASMAAYATWKNGKQVKESLGNKNGQGSAMDMLEYLKEWTTRHEGRHDLLEEDMYDRRN